MNKYTQIVSLDQIGSVVDILYALMPSCRIIAFTGALGAGKSLLIREILKKCGIAGPITSPTYMYVNIYSNATNVFYHFDLYRLSSIDQFVQAGFSEYLQQENSWSFIEWPEVIEPLLSDHLCMVKIEYVGPEKRSITITY